MSGRLLFSCVASIGAMSLFGESVVIETENNCGQMVRETVQLEFNGNCAHFSFSANKIAKDAKALRIIPEFMSAHAGEGGYWVLPTGEIGAFALREREGRRACEYMPMAFYGIKTEHGAYMAIVKGMANDSGVEVRVRDGVYQMYQVVNDLHFGVYEDLEVEFIRLGGGESSYSGMARAYRKFQLDRGAVVPLTERVSRYPLLAYAAKYPEVRIRQAWKPVPSPRPEQTVKDEPSMKTVVTFDRFARLADEFKRQGVEGAEFCLVGWNVGGHDGRWPQIFPVEPALGGEEKLKSSIRHVQDLGYQVVAHCNHRDAYIIADSWDAEYVREKAPDGSLMRPERTWGGGRMYTICPRRAYERFAVKDMPMVAAMGFRGLHYLDVFSCMRAEPCYDERHPLTARGAARYIGHIMQLARETFGGVASESGFDHHAGQLDYVLYVSFARPFDTMPDMVLRYVPLFQLVYNGIILSNPFTTTVNAMIKGRSNELKAIEFNARPSFYYYANFLSKGENWMGDADLTCDDDAAMVESVRAVKRGCDGYERRARLQFCFMDEHEEILPGVFRTAYSDGTRVYVNYGNVSAEVDGVRVLPEDYLVWRLEK